MAKIAEFIENSFIKRSTAKESRRFYLIIFLATTGLLEFLFILVGYQI